MVVVDEAEEEGRSEGGGDDDQHAHEQPSRRHQSPRIAPTVHPCEATPRAVDLEAIITEVVAQLRARFRYRLPINVATIAANGAVLFTRVTTAEAAGAVTLEHVAGDVGDEGFEAPFHLMATDATGRVRLAVARGSGPPSLMAVVEEEV